MYDPNNRGFVYQRFQRGMTQLDASRDCTRGLLLADYPKSVLLNQNVPSGIGTTSRCDAVACEPGQSRIPFCG